MISMNEYYIKFLKQNEKPQFIVEFLDESDLQILLEGGLTKRIKNVDYRKDGPHYPGDIPHCHAKLPDGSEVSYNNSGSKRHPGKFPVNVPKEIKTNIAKLLRVSIDTLGECYACFDSDLRKEVIIIEARMSHAQRILSRYEALNENGK